MESGKCEDYCPLEKIALRSKASRSILAEELLRSVTFASILSFAFSLRKCVGPELTEGLSRGTVASPGAL